MDSLFSIYMLNNYAIVLMILLFLFLTKKISDRLASRGMAVSDRNLVYELGIEDVLELVSVSRDVAKQYIDALKMMV